MAENLGNGGRPRNAKTLENLVAIRLQNLPTPNYYLPFPFQSPPTGRGGGGEPTPPTNPPPPQPPLTRTKHQFSFGIALLAMTEAEPRAKPCNFLLGAPARPPPPKTAHFCKMWPRVRSKENAGRRRRPKRWWVFMIG